MPNLQALAAVPSFGSQLGQALGSGISSGISGALNEMFQNKQRMQTGSALAEYLGQPEAAETLGQLPQEFQLQIIKNHAAGKAQKQLEKQNALQTGLETVEKMRGFISSAGPSNFISGLLGGDVTRDRAELETLGRSLIPLVAAGVPIRNQREFEEYRKIITNPNARQAEWEGALNGLEDLFTRSLEQNKNPISENEKEKPLFNPQNPQHKARAIKLHKALKDKEKVRKQLEKDFNFDVG